ncbi:glycoside hydrolase family 5 protein [Pedobacter xixiisoli]|uniref:Endoglucanase n=1 Tax=Pedobacter xixiisoli TaxID=1476464 RepID=A0A285ZR04_9SPHI|nr:glycoside hydrolase family 5 protein [Pedobacter xixiisoli]SOD12074.1 endoglucanase [Pedobacter xixiisoli]
MRKFLSSIIILICILSISVKAQKAGAPFGVNLAGAEFGKIGTDHYGYPTTAELDYFKSKGLTLFRLPFKWERLQPELNGALDAKELKSMKTFVDEAAKRNLLVILDMHNYARRHVGDSTHIINNGVITAAQVADAWQKIATEFKSYKNIWAYGLMNEPYNMPSKMAWFDIAQVIINSVRKIDTKTPILVGGDFWSSASRWQELSGHLKDLKDPSNNLIFEAHVYFDEDASGSYKRSYEEEKAHINVGVDRVKPFVSWLKENNKRGFVGEYGIPDNDDRWLPILEKTLTYLKENGVNGTYWAAGPRWGKYILSVEPRAGVDRPQMPSLSKFTHADVVSKKVK